MTTDGGAAIDVTKDDYLYFIDRALDGMRHIMVELGDVRAGQRPLPGANSPYGLLTHCLGVVRYWAGHLVAGREVSRDRAAEFESQGTVASLIAQLDAVRIQLALDLEHAEGSRPLLFAPDLAVLGPDRPLHPRLGFGACVRRTGPASWADAGIARCATGWAVRNRSRADRQRARV